MNFLRCLSLVAFVLCAVPAFAQSGTENLATGLEGPAEAVCSDEEGLSYQLIDLLDPERAAAAKAPIVATIQSLAREPGCHYERYLLGTLHRHGRDLPNNPLEKNSEKAIEYIEGYGRAGHAKAYADLAELALVEKQARLAMQWTQVYLSLVPILPQSEVAFFDRQGYNADLLQRATVAWHKTGLASDNIERDLQAYLRLHGQQIRDNASKVNEKRHTDEQSALQGQVDGATDLRLKSAKTVHHVYEMPVGFAVFLLEVQPSGEVIRIVPESFSPDFRQARRMRRLIEGHRFHPFIGERPQVARVPVQSGYVGSNAPKLKAK